MPDTAGILRHALLIAGLALMCAGLPARAADADSSANETSTVVLVAKSGMRDPLYRATVLVARPTGDGRHIGFILNKRTNVTLASAFPEHEPSKAVREPLYLGGPAGISAVYALVQTSTSPGKDASRIASDLFVATARVTVDRIIETDPEHARFFMGGVIWRVGELDNELKRGLWHVVDPRPEQIMPKNTEGMWEDMVRAAEISDKAI
ncbi:MAG: YqgE/AlgH family protein [Betaproteobacteria bacterium]